MKKLALFLLMALSFFNCQSQNNKAKTKKEVTKDTIKPQTKIKVNKQYDEFGNLISMDSTYTYFYSNIKGDSLLESDIFNKFKLDFNKQFMPLDSMFMQDIFKGSPFKNHNFYTDDFFRDNFKSHQKRIDKLLQQMDSVKNNFYKKQKKNKQI